MKKIPENSIQTEFLIHDLKVPVAVIDAGAKSLLSRPEIYGPLTEKQIKVLKRILRSTMTTQRLINDTLELGRSRQGVVSVCDFTISSLVTTVLMEIFDLLDATISEKIIAARTYDDLNAAIHDGGTGLSFDLDLWQSMVCLDETKIRQILRNLVTNAFKYRVSQIKIGGAIEGNFLILTVEDDGKGIPKKNQHQIFDSYFSTGSSLNDAVQSHGLGLAGVLALLKDMGGALNLESDIGKGAKFIVSIPLQC